MLNTTNPERPKAPPTPRTSTVLWGISILAILGAIASFLVQM